MAKKIPMRQCVTCREHIEKPLLARIVRTPQGDVVYDGKGKVSGRGAYICKNMACLEKAIKTKALQRALETEISDEIYDTLRRNMEDDTCDK